MTLDTREGVKERSKVARREAKQAQEVLVGIMSTNLGRRWMADLLAFCHVNHACFDRDSRFEAFMLGERNVGLRLQADIIAACPDRYIEMLKEQGENDGRRTDADASPEPGPDDPDAEPGASHE